MGENESTPIIATSKSQTGRAPWDYFSWGHIDMGIGSFLLLSLINIIPTYIFQIPIYIIYYWLMIVIVICFGIGWEILENTLLVSTGLKFENRRDSLKNALWDILFVTIGGFYTWIIKGILINLYGLNTAILNDMILAYFIVILISFCVCLVAFLIGRAMTK